MIMLARFILQRPGQAALVTATTAMLGVIFAPAFWLSAAAIALVTLVQGYRQGMVAMVLAALGSVVLANLILGSPMVVLYFVLMVWLPVWLTAAVLQQTVSLAMSLQVLTALCLGAIVTLTVLFQDFGELIRQPLNQFLQELASQSNGKLDLADLQNLEDAIIRLVPGFLASSILLGTMLSLSLARWWQAVLYNPGGFGKEFRTLNLGKVMAIAVLGIIAISVTQHIAMFDSMLLVVAALYVTQGMSIVHAVVRIREINGVWLFLIYILLLLIPEFMALVILIGLADAWIDFRKRLTVA